MSHRPFSLGALLVVSLMALALAATGCETSTGGGGYLGCVPDCDGKDCGDDGCGGTCGACEEGVTCDETVGACLVGDCGNGTIDEGESCDPPSTCPAPCDDGNPCTADTMTGSLGTCDVECTFTPIAICQSGDGCCPDTCDHTTDTDCSASCDDGTIDYGETCDPISSCPTSCDDGDFCTTDTLVGNPQSCTAECVATPVVQCLGGDGCCPEGCTTATDDDCDPVCGNDLVETGETCDPPSSCPTSCDDGSVCTEDFLTGSAADCTAECVFEPTSECVDDDGCCPETCSDANDSDCVIDCENAASWSAEWKTLEAEVVVEMNKYRAAGATCYTNGIAKEYPPTGLLTMNEEARQAGRCHSVDMAVNAFFSHTGSDGSDFVKRMMDAGYTNTPRSENIAAGYPTAAAVTAGWMSSETGHCDAIMDPVANEVGIGYYYYPNDSRMYGTYWTADFGIK